MYFLTPFLMHFRCFFVFISWSKVGGVETFIEHSVDNNAIHELSATRIKAITEFQEVTKQFQQDREVIRKELTKYHRENKLALKRKQVRLHKVQETSFESTSDRKQSNAKIESMYSQTTGVVPHSTLPPSTPPPPHPDSNLVSRSSETKSSFSSQSPHVLSSTSLPMTTITNGDSMLWDETALDTFFRAMTHKDTNEIEAFLQVSERDF
jgi:hypothetical protein